MGNKHRAPKPSAAAMAVGRMVVKRVVPGPFAAIALLVLAPAFLVAFVQWMWPLILGVLVIALMTAGIKYYTDSKRAEREW